MISLHRAALALMAATCLPAGPLFAPSAAAQTADASIVEGTWIGEFGQADWTIELKKEGSGWSGRYMSSKVKIWRALYSVSVSGRSVSFTVKSEPPMNFVLSVDGSGRKLSGQARITETIALPFSATRRP
jgi:hypothetical protein